MPVVEDVAHALGATYDGRMLGNHSEYAIYSFQAIKHLTTVDGGMLLCRQPDDLPRGRTEIDFYNRHLIDLAGDRPCPLNRAVYALVRRMESERIMPHPGMLDELTRLAA